MDEQTKKIIEYDFNDARLKLQQSWDSLDLVVMKLKSKNLNCIEFSEIQEKLWIELRHLDKIYFE